MKRITQVLTSKIPMGLGDFIKGSRTLDRLVDTLRKRNNIAIDLDFIIYNHPFVEWLDTVPCKIYNIVPFFLEYEKMLVPYIVASKEKKFISTNGANLNISNLTIGTGVYKNKLKKLFTPSILLQNNIQNIKNKYRLDNYVSLHLRVGDSIANNPFYREPKNLGNLFEVIEKFASKTSKKIVIFSDSFYIKRLLSKKYGFIDIRTKPVPYTDFNIIRARDTLLDFFILKDSEIIYNNGISNFSRELSLLYDIKTDMIDNIFIKNDKGSNFIGLPVKTITSYKNNELKYELTLQNIFIEKI